MATIPANSTVNAEIEFIPDDGVELVREEIEFIPDDEQVAPEVVAGAGRAATGALQALDTMAAPRRLDWRDVNQRFDTERLQESESLRAQATLAEEQGSGTGPGSEAFALKRQAEAKREQITPYSGIGRQLSQEGIGELRQIEEVDATDQRNSVPPLISELAPIVRGSKESSGAAGGGALGAAMFLAPGGGILRVLGPILGGLGGSMVGGAVQERLTTATETPGDTAARREETAQIQAENPGLFRLGQGLANIPFFGPSMSQFAKAAGGDKAAQASLAAAAGIGAGISGAAQIASTGQVNPAEMIQSGIENMILNRPTRLGQRMGFHVDTETGTVRTPDGTKKSDGSTVQPESAEGVALRAIKGPDIVEPTSPAIEFVPDDTGTAAKAEPALITDQPPVATDSVVQGEPTGIRNAIVDEARSQSGMTERELPGKRSFGTVWDEAKAVVAKDPTAGRRLVTELKAQVRPLTDAEDAILTYEQTQREATQDAAIEAVNSAKTPEELEAAQGRLAAAQEEAFEVYTVGQQAGTANARGLNARRLMINRDYSLAKMLNETRAVVNEGKPLSNEQTAEVTQLHTKIAELEGKLASAENTQATKDAQAEYRSILTQTKKDATKAAKARTSIVDFFDNKAEQARQRIIARRGRLNVTIDPLNIAGLVDEAIIGASYVAKGVRDFANWSQKMVEDFGDRIKPHLDALFAKASSLVDDNAKSFVSADEIANAKTPEQIVSSVPKGSALDQRTVYELARAHVRAGVDGFENVIKAVHVDLAPIHEGITEREIRDAFSGYGKITKPSKEADLVKLREYRNLARLTSQLEDAQKGVAPKKTGPQRDKATARVRELQKKVNEAMRKTGIERTEADQIASSLQATKTRIRNSIEDLQRKIAANDYEQTPKREPALDREKIDLQFQLAKTKEEYQKGLIEAKRAKRGMGEKIWDTTVETFNLSRQLLTSGDLPPVFRQGLFSIGRPKMTGKALADAFKAIGSEKQRFRVMQEIEKRPNAPLYSRSKLYLAKDGGQTLSQQEEAYMGNWFKNLPRWTAVGPFLRASERSYNTFLNKLRADTFDAMVKAYSVADTDTATLKRVADIINTMTGRATLPGKALNQGAGALNAFLFAPRFMASRFKLVVGEPMWTGNAKTRTFALEQYARTLAGAAVVYSLAKMAGAEIETDPRSTEFLKIKFGNTRIDPLGGLIQVTTFLTRLVTGETKDSKGKVSALREDYRPLKGTRVGARGKSTERMGSTIGTFLRSKLNPVAGTAVNYGTGKTITGERFDLADTAKSMAVPISFQDIAKTMEEQGVPKGTALWILSLFGAGLNTYEKR